MTLTTAAFRLQQKDAIDYSKQRPATEALTFAEPWQAVNIQNLNLTGTEASLQLRLSSTQQVQLSYTAVRAGNPPGRIISEYAYNYAAQNAIVGWTGRMPGAWGREILAYTQLNVVQRTRRTAYPLLNLELARNTRRVRPCVRLLNLSNTGYKEITGVPMQEGECFTSSSEIGARRESEICADAACDSALLAFCLRSLTLRLSTS